MENIKELGKVYKGKIINGKLKGHDFIGTLVKNLDDNISILSFKGKMRFIDSKSLKEIE